MAVPDTDDTNSSSGSFSPSPQSARPSWETAPRPAAAPRQSPAPRPAENPFASPAAETPSPYYAASKAAPAAYTPPAPAAYAAPSYEVETDVQYDLAGNPIPSSGPPTGSPMLAAPFGYSAGNAAPATWPPPAGGPQYGGQQPGGHQYGAQAYRNNSGEQSHLPPELEKLHWNWGAYFFPVFWTKKHGLTTVAAMMTGCLVLLRVLRYIASSISPTAFLLICVVYGLAYFGLQVFCGFNGHKIGWRNRHFPGGVEEYFKVQNAWMWWGLGLNVLLGPLLAFGAFAAIAASVMGTTHHHYRPYSNGDGTSGYSSGARGYGSSSYGNGNSTYGNGSSAGQ